MSTVSAKRQVTWLSMLLVVSVLVSVSVSAVGVLGCAKTDPLRFAVQFEDADGIGRSDRVVHRGIEIGRVTGVGIDPRGMAEVEVAIDDRYRTAVARNSVIRVDRFGMRRRTRLLVEDGEGERFPVRDGDVLVGSEGPLDDLLTRVREGAHDALEQATELARGIEQRLRELPDSEAARDFTESLSEAGRETSRRTSEGLEHFKRETLPALVRRAETVRKDLERRGMAREAEWFWNDFQDWLRNSAE